MEKKYPLTKQQEGLWIEWRLHPDNTSYNTCVKLRLSGELDHDRFERALYDVVSFFSSLRVYFAEEGGLPSQKVSPDATFTLDYEDISKDGQMEETPQQRKQAEEFLARKLRTPVDLKTFPIVRAGLMKTAAQTHYFIGIVPHMISDGVSAVLFLEATSIAYNKGMDGLKEAYGDTLKDWDDYFEHSISKENKDFDEEAATYWRERLSGAQHLVDFSHGLQESGSDAKTGKRVYFDLTPELSQQLKDYSRSQRTTLFSTLVGAFSVLVNRYYNQDDVLVGYPVNIRPPGYKHFFGFFVNIIPIRVDLSGDPTYQDVVSRISASRKADKKYQTFPALDIVREIRKSVSGFDGRVFNVSMAQTVSRLVNLRLEGIQSDPLEAEYNDVNDDLSLSYELLEDGRIGLWLEYRESLFSSAFVDQMIAHMQSLLQQMADEPEKAISAYELLNEEESKTLLSELTQPDISTAKDVKRAGAKKAADTIHGMIEHYAAQNPQDTALVYNDQQLSYVQMNALANQRARHIQAQGIGKGDMVALCLNRGPEMILNLLAVMKAGCAYVPIPPDYPKDRIEFILKDADCRTIITQDALLENFENIDSLPLIIVDQDSDKFKKFAEDNLDTDIGADDRCYVIYTSGSTGKPKGVLLKHGNLTPRLTWLQSEMPLNNQDVVLQNTDYSFDVSVAEIYWPLANGARLILTDTARYKDPSYLIDLINTHKVTTTCFVPSLLNSVLAVLKDQKLSSLKQVIAAGEALPPTLVKTYYQKCGGDLYNIYGPTEAAIYAAFKLCPRDEEMAVVPIGRPLGDTSLYILDKNLKPQPAGVAGELYIGGPGVAQGYLNRQELTAEVFLSDPFSDEPGAQFYKTGDLCRFNEAGDVEYLGRMDAQVKIRGFRIELAEIESVLSSFDGISDVAVIDYTGAGSDHKRLVAYYVSDQPCEAADLRQHVAAQLPPYMAPAFYVAIDEVPRLASGKINRRALPNPESMVKQRSEHVAPSGDVETRLAKIWSSILKLPIEKIGVHDSFFDMGGDSLMAIQFVCEAEEEGIVFETDTLFENNTIADLSKVAGDASKLPKRQAEQGIVSGTYPLLPRQAKFFADGFKVPEYWNRFFYFDVDHDVNIQQLKRAFDTVLEHHDNLRISFVRDQAGAWQQHSAPHVPDNQYVFTHDLSALKPADQEAKVIELSNEYQGSLDLEIAPLIRVIHFKTASNAGKLAMVVHHLLIDIVSSRIVFEDALKSYEALRNDLDLPLAPKTTPIKTYVEKALQNSETQDFSKEIAYWGSDDMSPRPRVPVDYGGEPMALEASCLQEKFVISEAQTQALLQDIPSGYGLSIQDFLLGCLLGATKEWTAEDELVVNICGHGRGSSAFDLSRTVGWLNTVFPLHLCTTPALESDTIEAYMRDIKAQIKRVPRDNGLYNLLYYSLEHPEITKHKTPEIFFNYVSQIDAIMPDGVSLQPIKAPDGVESSHGDNHLCYMLYMEAGVVDKKLNVHITYSQSIFKTETIEAFAVAFKTKLESSIEALSPFAKDLSAAE